MKIPVWLVVEVAMVFVYAVGYFIGRYHERTIRKAKVEELRKLVEGK